MLAMKRQVTTFASEFVQSAKFSRATGAIGLAAFVCFLPSLLWTGIPAWAFWTSALAGSIATVTGVISLGRDNRKARCIAKEAGHDVA